MVLVAPVVIGSWPGQGGGGVLRQDLGGVFGWDPTTVTLFMTEKSKIVYPVYDTYYMRPRM